MELLAQIGMRRWGNYLFIAYLKQLKSISCVFMGS